VKEVRDWITYRGRSTCGRTVRSHWSEDVGRPRRL